MKKQIKKRKAPIIGKSKKYKIKGFQMTKPSYYGGGAIHYISKDGKLIHDSKHSFAEIKKNMITEKEFKKRFYFDEELKQ